MKRNRLLIFGIAILVLLVGAMLLTACGEKHEVLKWKTIIEPTCTTEGMQRGACVECGEVIEEPIPTVEDNHVWGLWEITTLPTYARDGIGKATRVCTENSEHTQVVTLPRLTQDGKGYEEFEVYKESSVLNEGRLSAVYISEAYGEIAFTITLPKKEFDPNSVEDAVYLGSSNKALIRQGHGVVDIGYNPEGGNNYAAFTYEYGTDYVHINDVGKRRETWVSKTSTGELFGIMTDDYAVGNIIRFTPNSNNMNGYFYELSRSEKDFYGAEGLLYNAYLWGKKSPQKDYVEGKTTSPTKDTDGNVINPNGEAVYWFQFSYYSAPQYYNKVDCRFMLTESGALRYIVMYTNSYSRDPSGKGQSADQFGLYTDPDSNQSIAYLYPSCGNPLYNEVIEYHQDLIEEYPEEPVRENTEETFKVASFDIIYEGKSISEEYDEETTPHFPTGGGTKNLIVLEISNILPTTADLESDPISVYRIDGNKRILLDSSDSTDPVWIYANDGKVTVRSRLAGVIKLLFKSKSGAQKIVALYADYSAPSALYPYVYEYSDAGYSWKQTDKSAITTTAYTGQSVTMKAVISSEYTKYVDPSYVAEIASGPDGGATISVNEDGSVRFVATMVGEYIVQMQSTLKTSVKARVTITVEPAPDVNGLMKGEYTAKFKKFDATVSFAEPDDDGKIYATVTTDKGTEILYVFYNAQYNAIMSEHHDGANLGVTIELNEAYRLVLANPTGFGSGKTREIMYKNSAE